MNSHRKTGYINGCGGDIQMAKNQNKNQNQSKTNAEEVKRQNQQAQQGQGQYGTEFASETDTQLSLNSFNYD